MPDHPPLTAPTDSAESFGAFLDDLGLSAEELRAEAIRRHEDHAGACRLAYELYLAGTEQTTETFRGTRGDPVEDVRAHVAELRADRDAAAGKVREALARTDAAGAPPQVLAERGVSTRDALRARLADAVALGNRHPKDEVYAWLISAYSDALELASELVPREVDRAVAEALGRALPLGPAMGP